MSWSIQIADVNLAERYDDDPRSPSWYQVTSASDKGLILGELVEMLNAKDLDISSSWLRLVEYRVDEEGIVHVVQVEVF